MGQISKRVGITFHPAGVSSLSRFGTLVYFSGPADHIGTKGGFDFMLLLADYFNTIPIGKGRLDPPHRLFPEAVEGLRVQSNEMAY